MAGEGAALTPGEDLRLIETVYWDGHGCPRGAGHLARLAASAARFGRGCDRATVAAALAGPAGQGARLRLTLDAAGRIEVAAAPLPAPIPLWRLGFAGGCVASGDPWLGVKSTRRAGHDAARAALPAGLDEAIWLNERGEATEGTITNLFFDRGQGLRTPPRACGLLPGVLRAELLAAGCREEVLRGEDLPHVRLWVGNALRGLCPAVWAG